MHLLVANEVCTISFCFKTLHLLKSRILSSQSVPSDRGVSSHWSFDTNSYLACRFSRYNSRLAAPCHRAKIPYIHYHKQATRLEVCLVFKWTILISICQEWQRLGKGWGLGRAVSCSVIVERGTGCLNPSHCSVEKIGLYNNVRLFNRVPNIARTRDGDFSIGVELLVPDSAWNRHVGNNHCGKHCLYAYNYFIAKVTVSLSLLSRFKHNLSQYLIN